MKQTVAQCYSDCLIEEDKSYKYRDHRIFSFVTDTAKIVARILRRRKERNLRIHVGKTSLDLEVQEDAEGDNTANHGHRCEIVFVS